jgi:hypothetical protein
MHRFSAMNLARGLLSKASAGAQHKEAYQGDDPESDWPLLLAYGDAEMAERVVSPAIVQMCALGCGSPRRGCGIPADGHCLLAMLGTAQAGGPGQPRRTAQKAAELSRCADSVVLSPAMVPAANTWPVSSR